MEKKLRFDYLAEIINRNNLHSMVEIGIASGMNIRKISEQVIVKPFHYWGVDPLKVYPEYHSDVNARAERIEMNRANLPKNILYAAERISSVSWLETESAKAVEQFDDGVVELVFIDGNHTYEFVKQDIELWWPKVSKIGVMAFHDYKSKLFPGVSEAIDEFVIDNKLVLWGEGDVHYVYKT